MLDKIITQSTEKQTDQQEKGTVKFFNAVQFYLKAPHEKNLGRELQ
jgi:hypothetical protein